MSALPEGAERRFRVAWADPDVTTYQMGARFSMSQGSVVRIGETLDLGPKAGGNNSWSDERVEKLTQLWRKGLSASEIAQALGHVTRNAVIGKVNRLGLGASGPQATRAKPSAPTVPARKPVIRDQAKVFGETRVPVMICGRGAVIEKSPGHAPRTTIKSRAFLPLAGCAPVPFGARGCKWPIDGHAEPMACGADQDGGPYCAVHAAMSASAWQPAKDQPIDPLKWAARR